MADNVKFIRVHNVGEYGAFYLREGIASDGARPRHWCELTCNTSFGVVGHFWSHMGRPAAEFLSEVDSGYLIGKLWGMQAMVFDADAAMREVAALIADDREQGEITEDEARDRLNDLRNAEGIYTESDFEHYVSETDWLYRHIVEGGGGPFGKIQNPQATGFMRDLWPGFLAQLSAASTCVVSHG